MNTKLKNRVLWYNGISEVNSSDIPALCVKHNTLPSSFIMEDSIDVKKYNELYPLNKIGTSCPPITFNTEYLMKCDYDVSEKVFELFFEHFVTDLSKEEIFTRYERLEKESELILSFNLEDYIKSVYEVTTRLRSRGIVWAGRGSSCACYTLYILGIHNIDSVKYDIPYTEFFR